MALSTKFSPSRIHNILKINRLSTIPSLQFHTDTPRKILKYPESEPIAAELLAGRKSSSTRTMVFGDPLAYAGVLKDHNKILRFAYCVRVQDEYVAKLMDNAKF